MHSKFVISRSLEKIIQKQLKIQKSIILLGPRQTGKTTLLKKLKPDVSINLANPFERRKYEQKPELLIEEIRYQTRSKKKLLIFIDEIQKVPQLLDSLQVVIDEKMALVMVTGSSARKIRKMGEINLLPGRLIALKMDPLSWPEIMQQKNSAATPGLDSLLTYGSLPEVFLEKDLQQKETLLNSYVNLYLEEEIRAESITRNLPAFSHFLELAALESGRIVSFNSISQEVGVAHNTIKSYYDILEDTLIVERIEPLTKSDSRKKLIKSSRYLFFDLGVRRLCAKEGTPFSNERLGEMFEHFIGLELLKIIRSQTSTQLSFWKDADGPEVDWVVIKNRSYIPIEVKLSPTPDLRMTKHLQTFISEYPQTKKAFLVCRCDKPFHLNKNIVALPWQKLTDIFL